MGKDYGKGIITNHSVKRLKFTSCNLKLSLYCPDPFLQKPQTSLHTIKRILVGYLPGFLGSKKLTSFNYSPHNSFNIRKTSLSTPEV